MSSLIADASHVYSEIISACTILKQNMSVLKHVEYPLDTPLIFGPSADEDSPVFSPTTPFLFLHIPQFASKDTAAEEGNYVPQIST